MKSQVLHTVWCHISCEAAGEFWHWSLSGVKGLTLSLPRGINLTFSLQPDQKYYITQYILQNLAFHSFSWQTYSVSLHWKIIRNACTSSLPKYYCIFDTKHSGYHYPRQTHWSTPLLCKEWRQGRCTIILPFHFWEWSMSNSSFSLTRNITSHSKELRFS